MKKLLLILLLVATSWGATAQTQKEQTRSYTVYFGWNKWAITDAAQRGELAKALDELTKQPEAKIAIVGWADQTGSEGANKSMATRRAESVRDYLAEKGIASDRITVSGKGVDAQAADNAKARRAEVTLTFYVQEQPEPQKPAEPVAPQVEPPIQTVQEQQPSVAPEVVKDEITSVRKPLFALKTNLLYDAAMTPNLEIEIPIGKRWSVNAEYQIAWWDKSDNSFCWRINAGGVEARYWFGDREKRKPLNGWFAGVFVNGGTYDFQLKKDNGYQGNFIVPGISGGYAMPIARNLNLEFSLGVGYMISNYRHYDVVNRELVDNGAMKQFRSIFPAKAKVSLVWMINHNVKRGGK